MTVIDVDSHFMQPFDWYLDARPDLAARLPEPDMLELLGEALFGDLLANLPPNLRPNPMDLIPESFRPMAELVTQMDVRQLSQVVAQADTGALSGTYSARGA